MVPQLNMDNGCGGLSGVVLGNTDNNNSTMTLTNNGRSESPSSSGVPLFGSQLVDKNSATPYSDATQVST